MSDPSYSTAFSLEPADNQRLASLCGPLDQHLRQVEHRLGVEISNRGNLFEVVGSSRSVQATSNILHDLYRETSSNKTLTADQVHNHLQRAHVDSLALAKEDDEVSIRTRRSLIKPKGQNQRDYVRKIQSNDVNFGIGPAGTGKTYLAVACAVEALERDKVRRIVLARPAVEAGERLGFLPGDLTQKVDPYLRPLYDALYEMLGFEKVNKLIERHVIEVAPLAFMRGRTLNESFIILDEAQNTTPEQMKMFLTRMGFGSTSVITGDVTQTDLPHHQKSGLQQAIDILGQVKDISFTFFESRDVVRHQLIQRIIEAYEQR